MFFAGVWKAKVIIILNLNSVKLLEIERVCSQTSPVIVYCSRDSKNSPQRQLNSANTFWASLMGQALFSCPRGNFLLKESPGLPHQNLSLPLHVELFQIRAICSEKWMQFMCWWVTVAISFLSHCTSIFFLVFFFFF